MPADAAPDTPQYLHDDWLTEAEREVKHRDLQRQDRVRNLQHPQISPPAVPLVPSSTVPQTVSSSEGDEHDTVAPATSIVTPGTSTRQERAVRRATTTTSSRTTPSKPKLVAAVSVPPSGICSGPIMGPDAVTSEPSSHDPSLRRSSRANKGTFQATKYIDEAYLTSLDRLSQCDSYTSHMAYLSEIATCCDTGVENVVDPRVYASKVPGSDPDMPTFHQAMNGEHAEQWVKAMQLEVQTLVQQRTWTAVHRTPKLNVLKSTWAFKLKRLPDGTPYRFKARFCARGDLQKEGVDFFDTYAPVVQRSTIRLLLSTVLTEGWATRQVDYTNAFAQANLHEEVYLEYPKMFAPKSRANLVLAETNQELVRTSTSASDIL